MKDFADVFIQVLPYGQVKRSVSNLTYEKLIMSPDWFNPNTQAFWTGEFERFFDPDTGIDVDGAWLDMNEPSNVSLYLT